MYICSQCKSKSGFKIRFWVMSCRHNLSILYQVVVIHPCNTQYDSVIFCSLLTGLSPTNHVRVFPTTWSYSSWRYRSFLKSYHICPCSFNTFFAQCLSTSCSHYSDRLCVQELLKFPASYKWHQPCSVGNFGSMSSFVHSHLTVQERAVSAAFSMGHPENLIVLRKKDNVWLPPPKTLI